MIVAAAAAIAVLLVSVTLLRRGDGGGEGPGEWRGAERAVAVEAEVVNGALESAWAPVAGTDAYRIRLYRPDGTPVAEEETRYTSVALALGGLAPTAVDDTIFLEVEALGPLRDVLARSELLPLVGPRPGRD